jgi:hypothetical protein
MPKGNADTGRPWSEPSFSIRLARNAEKAIASFRHNFNEGAVAPHTVGELIATSIAMNLIEDRSPPRRDIASTSHAMSCQNVASIH